MSLRVAIVGPGRSNQGTGPYIAKNFHELGAQIVGLVSSNIESAYLSSDNLKNEYGIQAKAFDNIEELFTKHETDIVAICSPFITHLDYLKVAIENGCHIFCEKPLWWPKKKILNDEYIHKITKETISLVDLCKKKQVNLQLNTQWPFTLPAYYQLYPNFRDPITEFAMWLCPESKDENRILDSVPHLLSMLYALIGAGQIQNINFNNDSNSSINELTINFDYIHAQGDTKVDINLSAKDEFPKPAAYAINQNRADRHVELPNYLISLRSSETHLPLVDPLICSIKNFIGSIHSNIALDDVSLIDGMAHLAQIYQAVTAK